MVVALVSVVLIGAINRYRIGGQAAADWPDPPQIGSCIGIPGGEQTATVPCTEPHLQEVAEYFAATDPRHDDVVAGWDQFCAASVDSYLASSGADTIDSPTGDDAVAEWAIPRSQYAFGLLRAPEGDRVEGRGWLACTVRPQGGVPYVGSLRADESASGRPAAIQRCGSGDGATVGYSGVNCTEPHDWQILGQGTQSPTMMALDDEALIGIGDQQTVRNMQSSCRDFATNVLNVADPTYGGALVVDVAANFQHSFVPITDLPELLADLVKDAADSAALHRGNSGGDTSVFLGEYACRVSPADPAMQLTDGLEHWGDKPIPTAPRQ